MERARMRKPAGPAQPAPRRSRSSASVLLEQTSVTGDAVVDAAESQCLPEDGLTRRDDVDAELLLELVDVVDHWPVRTRKIQAVRVRVVCQQRTRKVGRHVLGQSAELDRLEPAGRGAHPLEPKIIEIV